MGYGNTYSEQEEKEKISQKQSLVGRLCNQFGYNREYLENVELEAKLSLAIPKDRNWKELLLMGEQLALPNPYARDKILSASSSDNICYAFVNSSSKTLEYAFTEVETRDKTKLKIKEDSRISEKSGIYLLRRKEKHIYAKRDEITAIIANLVRKSALPIEFIGKFYKIAKESFAFNPASGRIFVLSTGLCGRTDDFISYSLYQLEIEYYGQVNGNKATKTIEDEIVALTSGVLKEVPRKYGAKSSALTKLEWLASKNESFKNFRVVGGKEKSWLRRMFC